MGKAAVGVVALAIRKPWAEPGLLQVRRALDLVLVVREGAVLAELALALLEVLAHLGLPELPPEA
eukprot:CAMPEP_0197902932 /NCGR_PEP_ID=MMETSP1439-20131203/54709_1 /TAXON_ID=66791 /ORGANISM="Gonyaulax spinifera, Strain CCMP409" /LENGTH=64 /DNA_ID=CAMNT_0043524011 /DNA_START=82 /DNA_END=276 /DNA_ORIENTATION=-